MSSLANLKAVQYPHYEWTKTAHEWKKEILRIGKQRSRAAEMFSGKGVEEMKRHLEAKKILEESQETKN